MAAIAFLVGVGGSTMSLVRAETALSEFRAAAPCDAQLLDDSTPAGQWCDITGESVVTLSDDDGAGIYGFGVDQGQDYDDDPTAVQWAFFPRDSPLLDQIGIGDQAKVVAKPGDGSLPESSAAPMFWYSAGIAAVVCACFLILVVLVGARLSVAWRRVRRQQPIDAT